MTKKPDSYIEIEPMTDFVELLTPFAPLFEYELDSATGRSVKTDKPKTSQNFPGLQAFGADVEYKCSPREKKQRDGSTKLVEEFGQARVTLWAKSCPTFEPGTYLRFPGLLAVGYSGGISFQAENVEEDVPDKGFNLEVG